MYARLAGMAGIEVPETRLTRIIGPQRTFATKRFDRRDGRRRLYASAFTLTGGMPTDRADYIDIAHAIATHGAAAHVADDLRQLYRRMAFNVLAGNRDDHLRNHGFLRHPDGWRLAPAFDLNPARDMREHATAVNSTRAAPTAAVLLEVRGYFGLAGPEARAIIREVAEAMGEWRSVASETGIGSAEQDEASVALAGLESAAGT